MTIYYAFSQSQGSDTNQFATSQDIKHEILAIIRTWNSFRILFTSKIFEDIGFLRCIL